MNTVQSDGILVITVTTAIYSAVIAYNCIINNKSKPYRYVSLAVTPV